MPNFVKITETFIHPRVALCPGRKIALLSFSMGGPVANQFLQWVEGVDPAWKPKYERETAFPSAASLPKTDAFACGAAVGTSLRSCHSTGMHAATVITVLRCPATASHRILWLGSSRAAVRSSQLSQVVGAEMKGTILEQESLPFLAVLPYLWGTAAASCCKLMGACI